MKLPLFIAFRYLFSRKSHNVINVISAVSSAGMAIGTAALILILSVYNGFDRLIRQNLSDIDPDIKVVPAKGKYFSASDALYDLLAADDCVESCSMVLEDNVFLSYAGRQGVALAKGVDAEYERVCNLSDHIVEGVFSLHKGDVRQAVLGSALAYELGVHPRFLDPLVVYYPDRDSKLSMVNPAASVHSGKVFPSGLVSITGSIDAELILLPIETMRSLVGGDDIVSAAELRLKPDAPRNYASELRSSIGPDYKVLDRFQQHPSLYLMMRYEKLAVFLILIFVVIIIAFNIFGSLSMLIIEKQEDIATLIAMGADGAFVRRIFVLEGWLISLSGLLAGTVSGLGLALLQQSFGIVKLPGNFLIRAYPVSLSAVDVICVIAGVALIGLVIALLASRPVSGYAKSNCD